jgi:hypothetical protein
MTLFQLQSVADMFLVLGENESWISLDEEEHLLTIYYQVWNVKSARRR